MSLSVREWGELVQKVLTENAGVRDRRQLVRLIADYYPESDKPADATIGENLNRFAERVRTPGGSYEYRMRTVPGHTPRLVAPSSLNILREIDNIVTQFDIMDDGPFAGRREHTACPEFTVDKDDWLVCEGWEDKELLDLNQRYERDDRDGMLICSDTSQLLIADTMGYFLCDCTDRTGIHLCRANIHSRAEALLVFLHEASHAYWHVGIRLERRHEKLHSRQKITETLAEFMALVAMGEGVFLPPHGDPIHLSGKPLVDKRRMDAILSRDRFTWYGLGAMAYQLARERHDGDSICDWHELLVGAAEVERHILSGPDNRYIVPSLERIRTKVISAVRWRLDPTEVLGRLHDQGRRNLLRVGGRSLQHRHSGRVLSFPPCERYRIVEHVISEDAGSIPINEPTPLGAEVLCPICHKQPATSERLDTQTGKKFRCCDRCAVSIMT